MHHIMRPVVTHGTDAKHVPDVNTKGRKDGLGIRLKHETPSISVEMCWWNISIGMLIVPEHMLLHKEGGPPDDGDLGLCDDPLELHGHLVHESLPILEHHHPGVVWAHVDNEDVPWTDRLQKRRE